MRPVLYIAPFPMSATMKFATALASLENIRLIGVFQRPPNPVQSRIFERIVTVSNALDPAVLRRAVTQIQLNVGPIHRIEGILEQLQEPLALLRAEFAVEGISPRVAKNCRDKAAMKEVLRQAGIPCARHRMIHSVAEVMGFIAEVGYPIVLKPPSGAGCKATYRIERQDQLRPALSEIPLRPVLAEEFLSGSEHSMECLVLNGRVLRSSFSRYYPTPLEVRRNPYLQWVVHFPRELNQIKYARAHQVGTAAIKALGIDRAMTHMEWFSRPDGSVAIGEIGARPPGAQFTECTGLVHGRDLHRAWARLMIDGVVEGEWSRETSVAVCFLRGQGRGRILAVEGLEEAQRKMGSLVVDVKLPEVGRQRDDSYEGDGWVIIQDRDSERVKRAALELISTVEIKYQFSEI